MLWIVCTLVFFGMVCSVVGATLYCLPSNFLLMRCQVLINDPLRKVFMCLLIIVYIFILAFTSGYQKEDRKFNFVLFMFAVSIGVMAVRGGMITMFLGWDGLGLTSLWLILWYKNLKGNLRGWQVFSTMRVGDAFLILSFCFWAANISPVIYLNMSAGFIFLVVAARTKSAQFPFTSWLPKAMAAPTPVSALVHSSTLVTAGIILLMRTQIINEGCETEILSIIGLLTSIIGAILSYIEFDIKKRIAFRTLRHCGIIMYGLGLGQYSIVMVHLVLHAIIKSLLFILAGNSLISFSGNQDIRNLGTGKTVLWRILGLLIRRVPFIGIFYSKHGVFNTSNGIFCMLIIFLLRVLSFIYIIRLSLIGSMLLSFKTAQRLPSIVLLFQALIGILVSASIVLPADLTYFSPGLILLRALLIALTLGNRVVSYETYATRVNKSFIVPHFDKTLFIKRF